MLLLYLDRYKFTGAFVSEIRRIYTVASVSLTLFRFISLFFKLVKFRYRGRIYNMKAHYFWDYKCS